MECMEWDGMGLIPIKTNGWNGMGWMITNGMDGMGWNGMACNEWDGIACNKWGGF